MSAARGRWSRHLAKVATVGLLLAALAAATGKVWWDGQRALAAGDAAAARDDAATAIAQWASAARAYVPGAAHGPAALRRLLAAGEAAEARRDLEVATRSYRAARAAALDTAWATTPFADELARAEAALLRLGVVRPGGAAEGRSAPGAQPAAQLAPGAQAAAAQLRCARRASAAPGDARAELGRGQPGRPAAGDARRAAPAPRTSRTAQPAQPALGVGAAPGRRRGVALCARRRPVRRRPAPRMRSGAPQSAALVA
ncbi:MAG: hypothetical protein IPI49_04855 [Myxococcales bacterium]|nr:hypothetical protein [Myxococcales bacterium]